MSKVLKRLYLGDVVKSFGTKQLRKLTTEKPQEDSIIGTWELNPTVTKYEGPTIENITNATFSSVDVNSIDDATQNYISPLSSIVQGTDDWPVIFLSYSGATTYPSNYTGYYGGESSANGWRAYRFLAENNTASSFIGTAIVTFNEDIDSQALKKWMNENGKRIEKKTDNYLAFESHSNFKLRTYNAKKNWDGVLEYSTDTVTWNTWGGTTELSAPTGELYLRGIKNTYISFAGSNCRWVLSGSDIACIGNIENLLDYQTVAAGYHPAMRGQAFQYMFSDCSNLTVAPELAAVTLSSMCYYAMFKACTNLTVAPDLPAMVTNFYSCAYMFYGCSNLDAIPELPASILSSYCYNSMFRDCTKIKISTTQTDEYQTPYRIPISGTGTSSGNSLEHMFLNTGGTFTGTPSINTTYYTSNTVV